MRILLWRRRGKTIASPLAMIIGASTVSYPTRNHTNNNFDANRCWRGGSQWLMNMGNLRLFKPCWKLKWGNKIRSPLMLQNVFWCQPLWPLGRVYATNWDLYRRTGYAIYDKGGNKCMTMQLANFWVSKFERYIERNPGSGRQRYSGNIWQTRHAGKNCKVCLRTVASHCTNTLRWMSLPWCLRNCSLELRKRLCDQIIWQRNLGHCKNSWEQLKNWNWTNQRTNVDWSLTYSCTFPPALQPKFYIYTMICSQMATSLRVGDGLCSRFWRNTEKRRWSRTFGRLPLYDCSTKYLLTWYYTEYSHVLTTTSQKNNMVSVLDDVWKNICWPPTCSSIRPWRQTCQCGSWAWTCQTHLIEWIGVLCG